MFFKQTLKSPARTLGVLALATAASSNLFAGEKETKARLEESAEILQQIMNIDDKGIPDELLQKAHCVVIVPDYKKAAFIVGGQYGKGFMSCRKGGSWSAPAAIRAEG